MGIMKISAAMLTDFERFASGFQKLVQLISLVGLSSGFQNLRLRNLTSCQAFRTWQDMQEPLHI